jgi:hypothetical protein
MDRISKIKGDARKMHADAGWWPLQEFESHLANARSTIRFSRPYSVCVYCDGKEKKTPCPGCKGKGWLTEVEFKSAPEEMRP